MLSALKFAQGAIKKKSHAPELSHYLIKGGRVTGFNGHMALSAPIDLDFVARPHADQFYRAINACGDVSSLHLTPKGRLAVKSGGFKAFIPCLEVEDVYEAIPQGERLECPQGFLAAARRMLPFVGEDASRPWAMGMLVHQGLLMATNNVVLVQSWLGAVNLPDLNIPRYALAEIVRIGQEPESWQSDGSSLTLHYPDGRWLRTQLVDPEWPFEKLNHLFDVQDNPSPLPAGFADGVEKISGFTTSDAEPLYFAKGGLATSLNEEEGVVQEVAGLAPGPVFNVRQMKLVVEVAHSADFSLHPRPCTFYDKERLLRGLVIGRNA